MSRRNRRSLHHQVDDRLQAMKGFGRSKHRDKQAGISSQWIYSGQTMDAYKKTGHAFVNWVRDHKARIRTDLGHTPRTLDEVRPYASEWVQDQIDRGLSAYTIAARISGLSKIYSDSMEDCARPSVGTQMISRSRKAAVRDYGFNESRHADLAAACRCCGFRRHEAILCCPEHLMTFSDGYGVWIKGKGGRERIAPLVGSEEEIRRAVAWIQGSTGHNPIPSHMDVHSYRAEYAARVYHEFAQDIDALRGQIIDYTVLTGKTASDGGHIHKSALLHGRGHQKGRCFDRYALIKASQALGHNRETVITKHYSYLFSWPEE